MRFMGDSWFWTSWKVTEQKRFSFLRWCWLVRWRMNRSDKNTWYLKKDVPLCDPFCCCVIVEGKKDSSTSLMFGNLDTIPTALSVNNYCQTRIEDGSLGKCHDTWPAYSFLINYRSFFDWFMDHYPRVFVPLPRSLWHPFPITCVYLNVVLWETCRYCPGKIVILVEPKLVGCQEKFKIQIEFLIELNKILIQ